MGSRAWPVNLLPDRRKSPAEAQSLDQEREGQRGLALAWVIEVIARKGLAPTCQNPHQLSRVDVFFNVVQRQISQPRAAECAHSRESNVVDDQLPLDPDVDRSAAPLKVPHQR